MADPNHNDYEEVFMTSLTGDPVTDALVPAAQQLIGAVRAGDADGVDEAFAAAIVATGGRCEPGAALAIVCAAMVPDDSTPKDLLHWYKAAGEYARLIEKGVDPKVAHDLTSARLNGRVA